MCVIHVDFRGITELTNHVGVASSQPGSRPPVAVALYRQFEQELSVDETVAKVIELSPCSQDHLFRLVVFDFERHHTERLGRLADAIANLQGFRSADSKMLWESIEKRQPMKGIISKALWLMDAEIDEVMDRCIELVGENDNEWFGIVARALRDCRAGRYLR